MRIPRAAALAAALLAGGAAHAQQPYCDPRVDAECYQRWCRSVDGKPVYRGNWGCQMSGGSSGGYGGGSSGAELGRQIGGVLGGLIREGLFGNPQQDAQRRAEMEERQRLQELENQRRAEEIARQDEARYQRLRASLLDFSPAPPLLLMGTQQGGGLQLLMGAEAERSTNPALAELARAAAWSTLAARASTPEDAATLADAAFQSLIGGKVDLPAPPPDVKGADVHPMFPEVEPLKKRYLEASPRVADAMKPVFDAEQRVATFRRLEAESLALERSSTQRAQKAKAREAAREARLLREKADAELRAARSELEGRQLAANSLEQSLRAWLSSFAAGERKEDSYYYLGFEDGSQCFSQNAGPRCDKARAPAAQFETCLASYRRGYSAGEALKRQRLGHARESGGSDGHAGVYEINDARASGSCRYDLVMAYNQGYFGASAGRFAFSPAPKPAPTAPAAPAPRKLSEDERMIAQINEAAERLGWDRKQRDRLNKALEDLGMDGPPYEPDRIRESWASITARSSRPDTARVAAATGEGPGLYGAGTQTGHNDCAVFAVASASGRPYGVVAARATRLISEAEWRSRSERADPRQAIEKNGLYGGETVMLVEAFGRAEIVPPAQFAQTLKAGRPVLVNVVPADGDYQKGHQIVLAKTFQRDGKTWYEAIDSNRGPLRRIYLNKEELDFMIKENGVAYRPEEGSTVAPLRAPADR